MCLYTLRYKGGLEQASFCLFLSFSRSLCPPTLLIGVLLFIYLLRLLISFMLACSGFLFFNFFLFYLMVVWSKHLCDCFFLTDLIYFILFYSILSLTRTPAILLKLIHLHSFTLTHTISFLLQMHFMMLVMSPVSSSGKNSCLLAPCTPFTPPLSS